MGAQLKLKERFVRLLQVRGPQVRGPQVSGPAENHKETRGRKDKMGVLQQLRLLLNKNLLLRRRHPVSFPLIITIMIIIMAV